MACNVKVTLFSFYLQLCVVHSTPCLMGSDNFVYKATIMHLSVAAFKNAQPFSSCHGGWAEK